MASTYITRTVSSTGNQKTWTFSFWYKRTSDVVNSDAYIFSYAQGSSQARGAIDIDGTNQDFSVEFNPTGSAWTTHTVTSRKIRDISAWYHIVVKCDTTQATDSNRLKVYINGENQTLDSYPTQNFDTGFNASYQHTLGRYEDGDSSHLDGLLAHVHWTDGYAYDASEFGETDSTSGIWKPKTAPSVTYGTNGFFLKFENSGNLDLDSSGNNLTFTTGGTLTQNVDTPSNNFATLNALDNYYAGATLSNGNTKSVTGTNTAQVLATMGVSTGKWYWEVKATNLPSTYGTIGICPTSPTATGNFISSRANEYMYYSAGNLYYNGGSTGTYASYTTGDIIGVAMDLDNNRLFFSKNGTWQNSADPTTSTGAYTITAPASTDSGFYFPAVGYWDTGNGTFECNFGQGYFGTTAVASAGTAPSEGGIFEYDCPSGYQALCTKGINSF